MAESSANRPIIGCVELLIIMQPRAGLFGRALYRKRRQEYVHLAGRSHFRPRKRREISPKGMRASATAAAVSFRYFGAAK